MKKFKKAVKYTTNVMAILNALILTLAPIWNIPYADKISATLVGVMGVIGTYLLGTKTVEKIQKGK